MNAVIPGSFDPVTVGHYDLIRRAAALFDTVTVLLANNAAKQCLYSREERLTMLRAAVSDLQNVTVDADDGLLAEYCKTHNSVIVKGVRNTSDYEYEANMALANRALTGVETVLLCADPSLAHVSSSLVRELIAHGADYRSYLPSRCR